MNLHNFYTSNEWRKVRTLAIAKNVEKNDGRLICEYSGEEITDTPIVHHCIELTEENIYDPEISLNIDNLMVVSSKSHNKIHERFKKNYVSNHNVYIVYGSPRAGKNTYVESIAKSSDLICDIDAIWDCLCSGGRMEKPDRLKANVFGIRNTLYEQIKQRTGKWDSCYIVGGFALGTDRERLAKKLKAKTILIDTPIDVCLARCKTDNEREWVLEWFENASGEPDETVPYTPPSK